MLLRRSSVVGSGISRFSLWCWTDIRDAQKKRQRCLSREVRQVVMSRDSEANQAGFCWLNPREVIAEAAASKTAMCWERL